ncbi:MAG: ParA family protein [Desulfovibrionaceae bacterium]
MGACVLAIANQKGGVGKTTTALTLGAALVRLEQRVLVMDLDPHANASVHLSFFPEQLRHTARDLFAEDIQPSTAWGAVIQSVKNTGFDFVPGHIRLSELEMDLKERKNRGLILKEALYYVDDRYDYVLLDCPPHVGILLVNALIAADLTLIPIQTDFLAFYGLRLLFDTMRTLNRILNQPIRYKALATMYDQRYKACRRVLKLIKEKLPERTFQTIIHSDTKFREASGRGRIIFELDPESRGALEYLALAREIIAHENA